MYSGVKFCYVFFHFSMFFRWQTISSADCATAVVQDMIPPGPDRFGFLSFLVYLFWTALFIGFPNYFKFVQNLKKLFTTFMISYFFNVITNDSLVIGRFLSFICFINYFNFFQLTFCSIENFRFGQLLFSPLSSVLLVFDECGVLHLWSHTHTPSSSFILSHLVSVDFAPTIGRSREPISRWLLLSCTINSLGRRLQICLVRRPPSHSAAVASYHCGHSALLFSDAYLFAYLFVFCLSPLSSLSSAWSLFVAVLVCLTYRIFFL